MDARQPLSDQFNAALENLRHEIKQKMPGQDNRQKLLSSLHTLCQQMEYELPPVVNTKPSLISEIMGVIKNMTTAVKGLNYENLSKELNVLDEQFTEIYFYPPESTATLKRLKDQIQSFNKHEQKQESKTKSLDEKCREKLVNILKLYRDEEKNINFKDNLNRGGKELYLDQKTNEIRYKETGQTKTLFLPTSGYELYNEIDSVLRQPEISRDDYKKALIKIYATLSPKREKTKGFFGIGARSYAVAHFNSDRINEITPLLKDIFKDEKGLEKIDDAELRKLIKEEMEKTSLVRRIRNVFR